MFLMLALGVAHADTFATGSAIIPMDETLQDDGLLEAYGLVYALLEEGREVHWAVKSGKSHDDMDFTATAYESTAASSTASSLDFSGGPFVIDSSDVTAATSIITTWQGSHDTVVYLSSATTTAWKTARRSTTTTPTRTTKTATATG